MQQNEGQENHDLPVVSELEFFLKKVDKVHRELQQDLSALLARHAGEPLHEHAHRRRFVALCNLALDRIDGAIGLQSTDWTARLHAGSERMSQPGGIQFQSRGGRTTKYSGANVPSENFRIVPRPLTRNQQKSLDL